MSGQNRGLEGHQPDIGDAFKNGGKRNLRQIANELGVAHVVEGSVQRSANRVRVTAQLIDANTDTHLWVELLPTT